MKKQIFALIIIIFSIHQKVSTQDEIRYKFDASINQPFGLPNPEAPKQVLDWAPLIGPCDCISESRNQDQTWAEPVNMTWTFKYIMNGMGVQDETLREDGKHAGSIRQFNPDSNRWYVHYYSSAAVSPVLSAWEGNRDGNKIILYKDQKAPNGMEGWYKINFTDISEEGFQWLGEWVTKDESFSYPTWKISCTKRNIQDVATAREIIQKNTDQFSEHYMNGDYGVMAEAYTTDGKIFPNNARIIEGKKSIEERWVLPDNTKILNHKVHSIEIHVFGDHAYDYGYYEGKTRNPDGSESTWKGKYVIIWKKVQDDWKMYLDIWNRVKSD